MILSDYLLEKYPQLEFNIYVLLLKGIYKIMTLIAFCDSKELEHKNCIQILKNFEHGCRHFEFCLSLMQVTVVVGKSQTSFDICLNSFNSHK